MTERYTSEIERINSIVKIRATDLKPGDGLNYGYNSIVFITKVIRGDLDGGKNNIIFVDTDIPCIYTDLEKGLRLAFDPEDIVEIRCREWGHKLYKQSDECQRALKVSIFPDFL